MQSQAIKIQPSKSFVDRRLCNTFWTLLRTLFRNLLKVNFCFLPLVFILYYIMLFYKTNIRFKGITKTLLRQLQKIRFSACDHDVNLHRKYAERLCCARHARKNFFAHLHLTCVNPCPLRFGFRRRQFHAQGARELEAVIFLVVLDPTLLG